MGSELVNRQTVTAVSRHTDKWIFTQNWISYEIGVASAQKKDVWVVCDSIQINFPIPYLNCYTITGINLKDSENRHFWEEYLKFYKEYRAFKFSKEFGFSCSNCGATYNLLNVIERGSQITCPTCLTNLQLQDGWLQ